MAEKITITEALAELKTVQARLAKKRETIRVYFMRDTRLRDPFEKDGGTAEWVKRERQSVGDLSQRYVTIRNAIQAKNVATPLTVNGEARTVASWLNWRRELAQPESQFFTMLRSQITQARQKFTQESIKQPQLTDGATPLVPELFIGLDEASLIREAEQHEKTLGDLDGKLSLFNAVTTIEI